MKTEKQTFFVQITDVFGGEANFAWVTRHKITAKNLKGALQKLARTSGINWRINDDCGDSWRYDSISGATCALIAYWGEEIHAGHYVNEIN